MIRRKYDFRTRYILGADHKASYELSASLVSVHTRNVCIQEQGKPEAKDKKQKRYHFWAAVEWNFKSQLVFL